MSTVAKNGGTTTKPVTYDFEKGSMHKAWKLIPSNKFDSQSAKSVIASIMEEEPTAKIHISMVYAPNEDWYIAERDSNHKFKTFPVSLIWKWVTENADVKVGRNTYKYAKDAPQLKAERQELGGSISKMVIVD